MDQKAIAWQIKSRMAAQEISREDLCDEVGINKRTFYLVTTGRQGFTLELVKKIADALECKIEELLESIPEKYL